MSLLEPRLTVLGVLKMAVSAGPGSPEGDQLAALPPSIQSTLPPIQVWTAAKADDAMVEQARAKSQEERDLFKRSIGRYSRGWRKRKRQRKQFNLTKTCAQDGRRTDKLSTSAQTSKLKY